MEYQRSQVGSTSKTNCKMPQQLQVTAARLRVQQPGYACNNNDSCTTAINLTWRLSSRLILVKHPRGSTERPGEPSTWVDMRYGGGNGRFVCDPRSVSKARLAQHTAALKRSG
jgi:hypothetical protein